jgi:hypothetical protein
MNLGDWIVQIIVWGSFLGGSYALLYKFGRPIVTTLVSMLSPAADNAIMSRTSDPEVSEAVSPRTDAVPDGRTEPQAPTLKPETVDGARWLRERGVSRDEARAWLKQHGYSLGNDTWAAAKPPATVPDDEFVTPYAGRVTKRSFYTDADFPYEEPKV